MKKSVSARPIWKQLCTVLNVLLLGKNNPKNTFTEQEHVEKRNCSEDYIIIRQDNTLISGRTMLAHFMVARVSYVQAHFRLHHFYKIP